MELSQTNNPFIAYCSKHILLFILFYTKANSDPKQPEIQSGFDFCRKNIIASVNNLKLALINPLYSYLSTAKGVNVRWALGCKAGNPDLATPKIGSFYFPNIEV